MHFDLWRSTSDGKWYFHYVARNGEIVAPSQGYTRKIDARHAIRLLRFSFLAPVVELAKPPKARRARKR